MSETSKKRSRKSKLVPRECAVEDAFDLELQIPTAKLAKIKKQVKKVAKPPETTTPDTPEPQEICNRTVLQKINASANNDMEPESDSERKFEIKLEVETCDDEEAGENYTEIVASNEESPSPVDMEPVKSLQQIRKSVPIVLSRDIILDAADKILKTSQNVADIILNISLRNIIGYVPEKLEFTRLEVKIQEVLDEWRTWQHRSSCHREDPLFYKCYICTRSYWYLSEFRDHMTAVHADEVEIYIRLEKYEVHEVNVIASRTKFNVKKDIYTPGYCYRCGRGYNAHELALRRQGRYHSYGDCSKHFLTCMGVRDHFPWCSECEVKLKPVKCTICKMAFDTEAFLNSHLMLSHSVRSDIVISTTYKSCKHCLQRYICVLFHKCGNKNSHWECGHCMISFPSRMAMDIHMVRSMVPFTCDLCGVRMKYDCQKFDHMLDFHTDKYMMVKRCVKCEGLNMFLTNTDLNNHWLLNHAQSRTLSHFPNFLIPKSCKNKSLPVPESIITDPESLPEDHALVPEVQKPVSEDQELILIDQESIPEDQESIPEDQESLPDDQESIPEERNLSCHLVENVVVKAEPEEPEEQEDSDDISELVIKEEPLEEVDDEENEIEDFDQQIKVKEEVVEEEYEGDIIKLNFDIEDLLVKAENFKTDSTEDEDDGFLPSDDEELDDDENSIESGPEDKTTSKPKEKPKRKRVYKCTTCGFTANHKLYKQHVQFDCAKIAQKIYSCTKCKQHFASMKKYLMHFEEHGFKQLSCPECQKIFQSYTPLGTHIQSHVKQNFVRVKLITQAGDAMSRPEHQCKQCSMWVDSVDFFEHWELHVNERPTLPVKVSRVMEKKDEMREMMVKECIAFLMSSHPKECNQCSHVFKRVSECKRHIIEHLLVDAYKQKMIYKELRCQMCTSGFPSPEKYKEHMRDHASLPVYKCELCDRTFSDSSNFTKHKKVHNLKVIICDLCGNKFQSKGALEKHIAKHKSTEPVACKFCKKTFHFETTLRRHIRYFHDKTNLGFRCVICNERFDSLKLKWDHMWEIHKERKQKADCPLCDKSFRKYSDVRAHAKSVHFVNVSTLSVQKNKNTNVNVDEYLKNNVRVKVGTVETLVIYDSD